MSQTKSAATAEKLPVAAENTQIKTPPAATQAVAVSAPVLIAYKRKAYWLTTDGEILIPTPIELNKLIGEHIPIVCHAPHICQQFGLAPFAAYDVLELFAFVHPARFCLPSIGGLVAELKLQHDVIEAEDQCIALLETVQHLLGALNDPDRIETSDPVAIAWMMGLENTNESTATGWPWSPLVLSALGKPDGPEDVKAGRVGVKVWNRLQEWAEEAPPPPSGHLPVTKQDIEDRLSELLTNRGADTQPRPQQEEYSHGLVSAFEPRNQEDAPNTVIAEAGTGTGKTLAYLAPASSWADKNEGCVWISTYTKNLQRQLDQELDQLYPDPDEKKRNIVIRKGRENYLCLLNLEEALHSLAAKNNARFATGLGLVARWTATTRDGDLYGGDMPGWLTKLIGWRATYGLADRRGECMFSACSHYHRCFVEKTHRLSQRAKIVVANHALVMQRTAFAHPHYVMPNRYVFDEGHHLFDAADSAFALHLSGRETADMRRWLIGVDTEAGQNSPGRSRNRGLKRRLEDLVADDAEAQEALDDVVEASRMLPGIGWQKRLQAEKPKGLVEGFLYLLRGQVYARNTNAYNTMYSLETEALPPVDGLYESAYALSCRLRDLNRPLQKLIQILQKRLEDGADTLTTDTKNRIESTCHSLHYRADLVISGWINMLVCLQDQKNHEDFVDSFQVERMEGQEYDIGMYRNWIDPTRPFAESLRPHAHGVVVTSASLMDAHHQQNTNEAWAHVAKHTGITHLTTDTTPGETLQVNSPYDYAKQSRILIVNDVPRDQVNHIAKAYAALFKAAGGGALGLFTAVQRLKAVHKHLLPALEEDDLQLYAQHLDGLDPTTLTSMFRMEEDSCMLGTDATRDGMDVPGRSLRLIVFDRVPWPRPTILHKARRKYFGPNYDDRVTRFRLKQAYGRLIRHEQDKGVFVMLDNRLPTRLTSAFPDTVTPERVGLAEAVNIIKNTLAEPERNDNNDD